MIDGIGALAVLSLFDCRRVHRKRRHECSGLRETALVIALFRFDHAQRAVHPPSTRMLVPVMSRAWGEARKSTAPTTSSG